MKPNLPQPKAKSTHSEVAPSMNGTTSHNSTRARFLNMAPPSPSFVEEFSPIFAGHNMWTLPQLERPRKNISQGPGQQGVPVCFGYSFVWLQRHSSDWRGLRHTATGAFHGFRTLWWDVYVYKILQAIFEDIGFMKHGSTSGICAADEIYAPHHPHFWRNIPLLEGPFVGQNSGLVDIRIRWDFCSTSTFGLGFPNDTHGHIALRPPRKCAVQRRVQMRDARRENHLDAWKDASNLFEGALFGLVQREETNGNLPIFKVSQF